MSIKPPDWQDLIGAIYDAALDDALWTPALDRIMAEVGASQSALYSPIVDPATNLPMLLNKHVSNDVWALYHSYYWQFDLWREEAIAQGLMRTGMVRRGEHLAVPERLRRTEFYDFLRLQDSEVILTGMVQDHTKPQEQPPMILTFFRSMGSESFSQQDEELVRHLFPHLQRSLRIRWQMGRCREARTLREAALDQMAQAVALLDETGRVLFANRRAEAIFRDGGGPTVVNRHLTATDTQDAGRLKEALNRAVLGVGSSMRLEHPARQRTWVATFSPVRLPGPEVAPNVRVLVLIAEPDRPPAGALPSFARLYGLTPAETRVLEQLLQQDSTQAIAEILAIRIKTLRAHLSALFAKTGTASQRELVRFFLAHPAIDPPGSDAV